MAMHTSKFSPSFTAIGDYEGGYINISSLY